MTAKPVFVMERIEMGRSARYWIDDEGRKLDVIIIQVKDRDFLTFTCNTTAIEKPSYWYFQAITSTDRDWPHMLPVLQDQQIAYRACEAFRATHPTGAEP